MNKLILRQALLTEQASLLALEQKVIEAERPYNAAIKSADASYYDLGHLIADQQSCLLVAELNGTIVASGYAQIRTSKQSLQHDRHAYLGFMYVNPECRGLGINKQIIDQLIQWSKDKGVMDFYLDVYQGNQAAIRAYEKAGFVKSLVEMKLSVIP